MTEYDREIGDAFGPVLGIEPEWEYFNHEEYTVREIAKNQIRGRNDLWLDSVRFDNHQIPIVAFTDNEDLRK